MDLSVIDWSALAGTVSIACWVLVYTPQMLENYRRQSGEGLSLAFLLVWLLGDGLNLMGVMMEGLLYTQFLLGLYYVSADIFIIFQVYHYRAKRLRSSSGEASPLLPQYDHSSYQLQRKIFGSFDILLIVVATAMVCSLFFVYLLWPLSGSPGWTLIPKIVGWSSCGFYLCSRLPQILKNFQEKSCEGLSPFMFAFAVLGNSTYILSILLHSLEPRYLLTNLPWLLGSIGTLLFDFTIFVQFMNYSPDSITDIHKCEEVVVAGIESLHPKAAAGDVMTMKC
ncbi:uncharacterized protein VTP21DRAFT_10531 [Calcarisporiella thermophila]|uniref:uncharacterized protein n=1 Tax=Calcarisporiella thermophila TaxID=911321 RepID=UPI0037423546